MIFETKVSEVLGKIIRAILMKFSDFDHFEGEGDRTVHSKVAMARG